MPAKIPIEQLLNRRFGRLVIISEADMRTEPSGTKLRMMNCLCDCGNETKIRLGSLRNGDTNSCGCIHKEVTSKIMGVNKYTQTHGKTSHKLYWVYVAMKERCYNPNHKEYKNYGGRGISVCKEWLDDFMNFYNWAEANGYAKGLLIDRQNNDGNYEPSNCRWVTPSVSNFNKRNNKLSPGDYQTIVNAYLLGCFTRAEIAKGYNICTHYVGYIINKGLKV